MRLRGAEKDIRIYRRSSFKNRVRQRDSALEGGFARKCAPPTSSRAFAAPTASLYSFCNPASGNEGNVENKVGFIRRNLFTPPAQVHNIDIFNKHLLDGAQGSDKPHWIKGEPESALCLIRPSCKAPVRYVSARANKQGRYAFAGTTITQGPEPCGKDFNRGAAGVQRDTYGDGALMRAQARIRGCAHRHDQSRKPASAFVRKARRMENQKVRSGRDDLRGYLDSLESGELKASFAFCATRVRKERLGGDSWRGRAGIHPNRSYRLCVFKRQRCAHRRRCALHQLRRPD